MDGGGFEAELANMELDSEVLMGEGPENQQICTKWVRVINDCFVFKLNFFWFSLY